MWRHSNLHGHLVCIRVRLDDQEQQVREDDAAQHFLRRVRREEGVETQTGQGPALLRVAGRLRRTCVNFMAALLARQGLLMPNNTPYNLLDNWMCHRESTNTSE